MPDVGASADYGGNGAVMATRGEDAPSTWAIDAWSPRADEFALDQAGGGVTDRADTERISVQYANGERDVRAERFMFFDHNPDIRPGSVVYAPAKPQEDEGIDWGTVVSRTVSVVSTAATVMLAISRF